MTQHIKDELIKHGFVFLAEYRSDDSIVDIAEQLGEPLVPWEGGLVQTLLPRDEASPNTYSGIYGLNRFPFHSDLAHWPTPPRYLLLRCVKGYADVPTLLIDGNDLIEAVTVDVLARALFTPRRPLKGAFTLLRLYEHTDGARRIRWDEIFLKPASKVGDIANLSVRESLSLIKPTAISLAKAHDTLLIDNWRMLHARSSILPGREDRAIERIYLKELA